MNTNPTTDDPQFGIDGCTCIPFTRQTDPPRYCQPGDTIDMVTGWERGRDCPHHTPAPSSAPDQTLRDRIAAALREHWLCTVRADADADGNLPCRCGDWREPGAEADDENDWDSHLADAVLAVLHSLTLRELEQLRRPNTPPSRPEPSIPDHTVNEEEAPHSVKQRLVPRAVRPLDVEHDELMARADAAHQARTAAEKERKATDRAVVLREAAAWFERDGRLVRRMFGHQVGAELRRLAAEAPQPDTETAQRDVVAAIVAALQERAGELSTLAEEQMRPSLEERAQEWLEAAEVARKAATAAVPVQPAADGSGEDA